MRGCRNWNARRSKPSPRCGEIAMTSTPLLCRSGQPLCGKSSGAVFRYHRVAVSGVEGGPAQYDEALAKRGLRTVFVLRFIFWMPPLLHAFFGVSRVRFWTHFWGSLAGYVLPLLLVSYFGQKLFDALRKAPLQAWIALGAGIVVVVTTVWLVQRRRQVGHAGR